METLLIISLVAGLFSMSQPSAGTFTAISDGSTIVRMDTRTGAMERCSLAGNILTCKAVVAGEAQKVAQ